jgi:hypothetical protein
MTLRILSRLDDECKGSCGSFVWLCAEDAGATLMQSNGLDGLCSSGEATTVVSVVEASLDLQI